MRQTLIDLELQQITFLDERFYRAGQDEKGDSIYYPSVTTILDLYPKGFGFTNWLKDVGHNAKAIAEKAAESGNKVHNGIEALLKGAELVWDEEVYDLEEWQGLMRFVDFYESVGLTKDSVYGIEVNVFSHAYKYAGTADLVCRIGDQTWLIDHKFGNSIYPNYYQQLVAYKVALEEMNPEITIDRVGVLHLKANRIKRIAATNKSNWQGLGWQLNDPMNDKKTQEMASIHGDEPYEVIWNNFQRTLGIYYYENPNPKPKNEVYPTTLSVTPREAAQPEEIGPPVETLNENQVQTRLALS